MTLALAGSWNLHTAISTTWTAKSLDATFRTEWADPSDTDHQPLNDTEARPSTPVPYCVFTVEQPVSTGHSTGINDAQTERKYVRIGVLFQVYAKRKASGETGKSVAARMLQAIATAFDPSAGYWTMPDGSDYIQRIQRASEWLVRQDENTWEGAIRYEVFVDQAFARRPI